MIAADDAMLAASDPAVPGLATVLDEERLAALLRANLSSVPIGVARRTYARYKPERSCVVAYRLEVAGSELDVYAIAHRREHFARHASNLSGDRGDGTALGRGVALEEASVIVRPFTADRRIATLAELADEARRRKLVYELLPGDPSLWSGKVETLRYWPERRFTCCLTIAGEPRVVVKFYNEALYPPAARAVAAFDCRAPRIPRLIASSDRHRALVFQWLSGERLDRAMAEGQVEPAVLERVGVALSELHSQSAAGLRCKPPGDRGASLEKRAAWVAAVCEDVARPAKALAARLADGLVQQAPELCAIHGDFSPAQVLLNGAAPAIIDLDAAGRGDPVADLGSFAAHLERQALDGKLPRVLVELFRKSLLTGYESHGGSQVVDPARLRLWTAVELLRRAPGAFRRRRDGWRAHVAALIAQAEKVLDAPDV